MLPSNQISVSELQSLIGTPDCPQLVDVCVDEDFALDPRVIPTARRHAHKKVHTLVDSLGGQDVVFICQKGLKLSMGASAVLRSRGINARFLAGGNHAWRDAGGMLVSVEKMPQPLLDGSGFWVLADDPDTNELACVWLIKRFVDREAGFLLVDRDQLGTVAEKFAAETFASAFADDASGKFNGGFGFLQSWFDLMDPALAGLSSMLDLAAANPKEVGKSHALDMVFSGIRVCARNEPHFLENSLLVFDALFSQMRVQLRNSAKPLAGEGV